YSEELKNILAEKDDSLASILQKLPAPVPVDEVKLFIKTGIQDMLQKKEEKQAAPVNWWKVLITLLLVLAALIVLLFLAPWIIWLYYHLKAKGAKDHKAFHCYRASIYYLNQLGYSRHNKG